MRSFGHLFEGMEANEATATNKLALLQEEYKKRLYLARMSRMPEGARFMNEVADGGHCMVPLLSPPDMVAVRRADGSWFRRTRGNSDIAQPYTDAFYQDYLLFYKLPLWFFRVGHLAMLGDYAEARLLGIRVPDENPPPRRDYLEEMYSLTVIQPTTLPDKPDGYLLVGLSEADTCFLARRWPATTVEFKHSTWVTASGHIVLRSVTSAADKALQGREDTWVTSDDSLEWVHENPADIKASYHLEVHDKTATPSAEAAARARTTLARAHARDGSLVNPTVIPAGPGRWEWFDDTVDRKTAVDQGYEEDFVDITKARGMGSLPTEPDSIDFPSVVWIPDKNFRNLNKQPKGPGRWEFLTSGDDYTDDMRAASYFGGLYQLPKQPTARQIFRLRQMFAGDVQRPEVIDKINIVWVAGTEEEGQPAAAVTAVSASDTNIEADDINENVEPEGEEIEVDAHVASDLDDSDFNPTNGEPYSDHDQTGKPREAKYYTSRIMGNIITLDRSRVVFGERQIWKAWAYSNNGWQRYPHFTEINWNDQKSIDAMAKWREQANRRGGWPKLRDDRPVYGDAERKFVRDQVQRAVDTGMDLDNAKLYNEFKKAFSTDRTRAAVSSLARRIRREIENLMAVDAKGEMQDGDLEDAAEPDDHPDHEDAVMGDGGFDGPEAQQDTIEDVNYGGLSLGDDDGDLAHADNLWDLPWEDDEDSLFIT